jgi:molecular chaperone GrpE (heat shock protein)
MDVELKPLQDKIETLERSVSLLERKIDSLTDYLALNAQQENAYRESQTALLSKMAQQVASQPDPRPDFNNMARELGAHLANIEMQLQEKVQGELNRVGKTMFKLTTIEETGMAKLQLGINLLEHEKLRYQQQEEKLKEKEADWQEKDRETARNTELKIAKDMFALLDALDAGVETGERLAYLQPSPGWFAFLYAPATPSTEAIHSWLGGIKLVHKRALSLLANLGITPINSTQCPFDPKLHRAVGTDKGPDNVVVKEVTKGYKAGDQILRYAEVIVGKV